MPTLEDACIAYQLYCEAGRIINVADWMRGFIAVHQVSRQHSPQFDPHRRLQGVKIESPVEPDTAEGDSESEPDTDAEEDDGPQDIRVDRSPTVGFALAAFLMQFILDVEA